MINILVTLEVKNFNLLADFERIAVQVMQVYGGSMIGAFETIRNADGTGEEIHLLEFPSESAFADYRSDSRLSDYAELRAQAISSTHVIQSSQVKTYI